MIRKLFVWVIVLSAGVLGVIKAQKTGVGTTTPIARFHVHTPFLPMDSLFMITKGNNVLFVVTSTGEVGINVAAPSVAFDHQGTARFRGYKTAPLQPPSLLKVTTSGLVDTFQASGNGIEVLRGDFTWGPPPSGSVGLWQDFGPFISPTTLAAGKFFAVNDSGWIGIGTNNPMASLHVIGPIWQTGLNNSILIGVNAGASLFTGGSNVLIGDSAGLDMDEAFFNVAVGYKALMTDTQRNNNTAVGYGALSSLIKDTSNVAIGAFSLLSGQSNRSVSIGAFSINSCVSCADNVAIGPDALRDLQYGTNNVAIGTGALRDMDNGNFSIAIGYNALSRLRLAFLSSSPMVAIGDSALASTRYTAGNTAIGFKALARDSSSSHNTAVGFYSMALRRSGSGRNVAVGSYAMYSATGDDNIAMGHRAIYSSGGFRNIAIGNYAMEQSGGNDNVAIGNKALRNNRQSFNVAIGNNALVSDTMSVRSIAIGDSALWNLYQSSDNVAIGTGTMKSALTGSSNNVMIGKNAGKLVNSTVNIPTSKNVLIIPYDSSKGDGDTAYLTRSTIILSNGGRASSRTDRSTHIGMRITNDIGTGSTLIGNVREVISNGAYIPSVTVVCAGPATDTLGADSTVIINVGYTSKLLSTSRVVSIGFDLINYLSNINNVNGGVIIGSQYFFTRRYYELGNIIHIGHSSGSLLASSQITIGHSSVYNNTKSDSIWSLDNIVIGHGSMDEFRHFTMKEQVSVYNTVVGNNSFTKTPVGGSEIAFVGNNSARRLEAIQLVGVGNQSLDFNNVRVSGVHNGIILLGNRSMRAMLRPGNSPRAVFLFDMDDYLIVGNDVLNMYVDTLWDNYGEVDHNMLIGNQILSNAMRLGKFRRNVLVGTRVAQYVADTFKNNVVVGHEALSQDTLKNTKLNVVIGPRACNRGSDSLLENVYIGAFVANGTNRIVRHKYNTAVGAYSGPVASLSTSIHTGALGYRANPTASYRYHFGNTSVNWIGGNVNPTVYSDSTLKYDIKDDVLGLRFIMGLRPVTYNLDIEKQQEILYGFVDTAQWQGKYDIESIRFSGFIAQEVDSLLKSLGKQFSGLYTPDEIGGDSLSYSISYEAFVVPLVKAIQEQQEILRNQEQQIASQQQRIKELKERIAQRQRQLEQLGLKKIAEK